MNLYMKSFLWIHTQTLLCTPNSNVFFMSSLMKSWFSMNSYMNSWFSMNSYMNWRYEFRCKHFFLPLNSWFFMNSCRILWILALFPGKDHIQSHVWKISWRISWIHEVKKRSLNWIHRSVARTRRVWQDQPEPILQLLLQSYLPFRLLFELKHFPEQDNFF